MGGLADLLDFEHSNLGSIWKRIQKDPERVFIGAIDSAGTVAPNTNATNPALIDSAMGTQGYGASSAGPGGGSGFSLSAADMQRMSQAMDGIGDNQQQQRPIEKIDLAALSMDPDAARRQQMALSSKKAKGPAGGKDVLARGLSSRHPIDVNGAQIAAIQELSREVKQLQARLAQVKAKRRGRKSKGK